MKDVPRNVVKQINDAFCILLVWYSWQMLFTIVKYPEATVIMNIICITIFNMFIT